MSLTKVASALRRGDVVKIGKKKAAIVRSARDTETVSVTFLPVIAKGELLGLAEGWSSVRLAENIPYIGKWEGDVRPGIFGHITIAEDSAEGEGHMATTAKSKSGAKKGAAKGAASKSKSNGGEKSKRASNEELDALAAKVVDLRDNKGKSWGEIEEALDVNPGRLRSLYNRGGGEPTRERKGAAKAAAPKKSKGSTRRQRNKKADPSE